MRSCHGKQSQPPIETPATLVIPFVLMALCSAIALADPEGLVGNVLYPRMASPATYHELPPPIIGDLERRGCRILQPAVDTVVNRVSHIHFIRANVIRGSFAQPSQKDWAVLCTVKKESWIIVYWAGSTYRPSSISVTKRGDYIIPRRLPSWHHDGILVGQYESEGAFLCFAEGRWTWRG